MTRKSGRIARDVFLRRLGVERSYRPRALFRNPAWNFAPLLKDGIRENQIQSVAVRCATVASLLQEYGLAHCALLQIDAEGYDYQIIQSIDFRTVQPLIVRFEQVHLTDRACDHCIELLASH